MDECIFLFACITNGIYTEWLWVGIREGERKIACYTCMCACVPAYVFENPLFKFVVSVICTVSR